MRRRRRELGLTAQAYRPQVHDPGVTVEVDWGEAKVLIAGVPCRLQAVAPGPAQVVVPTPTSRRLRPPPRGSSDAARAGPGGALPVCDHLPRALRRHPGHGLTAVKAGAAPDPRGVPLLASLASNALGSALSARSRECPWSVKAATPASWTGVDGRGCLSGERVVSWVAHGRRTRPCRGDRGRRCGGLVEHDPGFSESEDQSEGVIDGS